MARKDQHSPEMDQCDICGAVLDDDSVIQEFPDGSVVKLCGQCASEAVGESQSPAMDEPELERVSHREQDADLDEATVEWSGPDQEQRDADPGVSGVEAELAAWASAPHENVYASDDDYELSADYDDHDAEEAAHELAAALAQANMADAEREAHGHQEASEEFEAEDIEWVDETPPELPSLPTESEAPMPPLPTGGGVPVPPPLPVSTGPAPAPPPLPREHPAEAPEAQVKKEPEPPATAEEQVEEPAEEQTEEETEVESDERQKPAAAAETAAADKEAKPADKADAEQPEEGDETSAPVNELIALRTEMQTALSRLSSTLEHFVEEIAASEEKTKAMSGRLHDLEDELDSTRERLRIAEGLPPESETTSAEADASDEKADAEPAPEASAKPAAGQKKASAVAPPPLGGPAHAAGGPAPPPLPGGAAPGSAPKPGPGPAKPGSKGPAGNAPTGASPGPGAGGTPPPIPPKAAGTPRMSAGGAAAAKAVGGAISSAAAAAAPPPMPAPSTAAPASSAVAGAAAAVGKLFRGRKDRNETDEEPEPEPDPQDSGLAFNIHELQSAQRYFNTSEFVKKVRDISRSIGRPQANLSRVSPNEPLAAVTIFWDIVWYQYLIDLRKELPPEDVRVWLDREGMDLEELDRRFTQKNANVNDDGRVDASLMEIDLLSDPSTVIEETPVDPAEARLAEDATEEIWDHRSAPDFRWD